MCVTPKTTNDHVTLDSLGKIESIIGVQLEQEKPKPMGPSFQWDTSIGEFPIEQWTRGLGFPGTTEQ